MAFLFRTYRIVVMAVLFLAVSPVQAFEKKDPSFSTQELDSLYSKAQYYLEKSADSCLMACNRALLILKGENNREKVLFHSMRGIAYEYLGRYRDALSEQFMVYRYMKKYDTSRLGNVYNNIGVIYDFMGNLDSALYYYYKGYEAEKRMGYQPGISSSAGNLGLTYLNKGNFKRALDFLFEAKKIAIEIKDSSSLSACLTNIGLVYDKQGNHVKALQCYRESGRIDSLLGDYVNLALSYNNIGSVYFVQKDYENAERYHLLALKIRTEINLASAMAESYHSLALVFSARNETEKALTYFEKSLEMAEVINDSYGMMSTMMDMGNYYNRQSDFNKAIHYLQRAIEISKSQGGYGDVYKAYGYLSKAYAGKGDYQRAYEYYVSYTTISDSLKSYDNSKRLTELELESEYEIKKERDAFKIKQRELKLDAEKKQAVVIQWSLIGGMLLLLVVVVVVLRGYRNKQKANQLLQEQNNVITRQHREIEEQKNIIEEKNKNITDSIQYAQRLQNAILPPHNLLATHLHEFFILYRPKDIVSGDFYWAHESPHGFLFAVVDCTGHGVPGSMVSIIANNALNRTVNEFKIYEPAAILNKVATLVEEYFNRNTNSEIRDGMDISLCLIDAKAGTLQFAGANNSLYIVRQETEPRCEELKADKQPIGHYEHRKPYQNHVARLYKGDMLYLYTDGYADQFGGTNGKKFKSGRLREVLLTVSPMPVQEQKERLEEILDQWTGSFEQNDDICLMGIRV